MKTIVPRSLGALALLVVPMVASCRMEQILKPAGDGPPGPPQPELAPRVPASLGQFRIDGTTPVGAGSTLEDTAIVIAATVSDPEPGDMIQLQLELRPVGRAFTGSPTHESAPVASGARAIISIVSSLADTSYHWQVRAVDQLRRNSAWVEYGTQGVAFRVSMPKLPLAPRALAQFRANGETPIPVGGTTPDRDVILVALVDDPQLTASVTVEFEVRSLTTPLRGEATHSKEDVDPGEPGSVKFRASAFVGYHWQSRVCNGERCSAWTAFGGNGADEQDFIRDPFDTEGD